MRKRFHRVTAALLAATMLLGMTACGGESEPTPSTDVMLDNGNILTAPAEQGTEEELTAVRDKLVKARETKGLGTVEKLELYENGVRVSGDEFVQVKDNKKFYYAGDVKRLVNYPDGYMLDLPADWEPDFSLSTAVSVFETDDVTLVVSDESDAIDVYGTAEDALDAFFQYTNNTSHQNKNRIKEIEEQTVAFDEDTTLFLLRLRLLQVPDDVKSYYTYAVFYSERKITYLMFKCIDNRRFESVYSTYQSIYEKGYGTDRIAYPEEASPSWNEETRALYDRIQNTDKVMWGLYNGNMEWSPLESSYPSLEAKLEHKFDIVTSYTDSVDYQFPVDAARAVDEDGRFLQFTFHFGYGSSRIGEAAPILDVYRGRFDEDFRRLAKQIVAFGRPMLFRVNNEMNSDWTSWAAVNALNDPAIFCETWIRLYDIFEEEGANEFLIWVWNPQGAMTAPVANWNDLRLYMPGAKYVDMLGLTAYNFGDDEQWSSFEELYDMLETYYAPLFGDWAWMISEFGCSDSSENPDNEGRRVQWIEEMFDCFEQGKYPNIKAAVWFNSNDYANGELIHEISLSRDAAACEAFADGLDRTQ
ncbi:MAG: hypothetical protein IJB27_05030 [Clostridia bacterium]|nr:hypothetical protein [Clostridia bacterium]